MTKNFTQGIKGISIIIIVAIHCLNQFGVEHIQFIAAIGVSLFLIVSGYGIECSYQNNGLKWFWLKRFLTVIIPYWIVQIAASIVWQWDRQMLINGICFIESNWFVPYILGCYLIFWITSLIFKHNRIYVLTGLFIVWLIIDSVLSSKMLIGDISPILRTRQMLCFPFGMWLARGNNIDGNGTDDSNKGAYNTAKLFGAVGKLKQCIIGVALMIAGLVITVISQLGIVESMPMLLQGAVSIFTVFPIAVGALMVMDLINSVVGSKVFVFFGMISYELFLTHWQSIDQLYMQWYGIRQFLGFTLIGTLVLVLINKFVISKIKKIL